MKCKSRLCASTFVFLVALATGGLAPTEAAAQSSQPEDLSEVLVTATRRDTALQDVPITVDVFTAEELERDHITRPVDFLAQTANVNLITAVRPGESDVSMRGIQGNFGLTQPVAVVVDGVVAANPNALDQELVGVQQIEVVKGPQSALYGRNANAGAIIINTARPTPDFQAKVVIGAGNGEMRKAQALISGPLGSDKLAGRLALSHNERDGYWDNATIGRPADIHEQQIADARFIFEPSDALTFDVRAKASGLKMGSGLWDVQVPPFIPIDNNNYFPPFQMNNAPPAEQTRFDFSLKADYELPFATVTAIGSYDDYDSFYFSDGALHSVFPGGPPTVFVNPTAIFTANPPLLPGYSYSTADGNAYSELNQIDTTFELRLTSPSDQRFRWFVGGYYADSRRLVYTDTRADRGAGIIEQILGEALNPAGTNPIIQVAQYFVEDTENSAAFGQLQYDLGERVTAEVSLRYDEDTKRNTNHIPNVNSPVTGRPLTNPAVNPFGLVRESTFTELQPKYSLRFKPTDDVTLFASVGRGFRSGGFNGAGTGAAVRLQAPTTNFPDAYPEESSDAYELGFKTQWLGNRLTVNGAVFYTDIENAQAFTAFPAPPITIVISLEEVRSQGFELDVSYRLTDHFRVSNSYGYTDTEIKRTALAAALGKQIPGSPDYTNSFGIDHDWTISEQLALRSHVEWQLTGPMWFDVYNTAGTERDQFSLVNARFAFEREGANGTWQVAAWARNLLDELYNVYSAPVPPIANFSYRAAPRMYGVDLVYRF